MAMSGLQQNMRLKIMLSSHSHSKPKNNTKKRIRTAFCILFLLASCFHLVISTCPATATSSLAITSEQENFTGGSNVSIAMAKVGTISNNMYYLYNLNGVLSVIRKVNSSNILTWMAAFFTGPIIKSLSVDSSEQNLYYETYSSPIIVFRISCSTGGFISAQSFTPMDGNENNMMTHILSDNSGYYVVAKRTATSRPYVCKYLFSASTTASCQEITAFDSRAWGQLKINDSQLFLTGNEPASTYHLHMYKITFGNTAVDWANKVSCTSGTCSTGYVPSIMSIDGTQIYNLYTFGATRYLYFAGFNITNGSVVGSRYMSSVSCGEAWGIVINGNYLITLADCGIPNLFIYNTLLSTFKFKGFNGNFIFDAVNDPSNQRIVIVGKKSSQAYMSKFFVESVEAHPDFSSSTITMNVQTATSMPIIQESSVTIGSVNTESISSFVYSNQTVTYSISAGTSYTSDVYFQVQSQSYLAIVENTYIEYSPDLPCSSSGSTSIAFSLAGYNGGSVPTWLAIDAASGTLKITAPSVTAATNYTVYISSQLSGVTDPVQKQINIQINKCTASNCAKCTATSTTTCAVCNTNFSVISGYCCSLNSPNNQCPSSQYVKTTSIIITSLTLVTSLCVFASSMINTSNLTTLWLLINQIQMFFLLLLTEVFISNDVINVIIGSKILLFIYPSIPYRYINFESLMSNYFDIIQPSPILSSIGVTSGSTFVNIYPLISFLFCVLLAHIALILILKRCMCSDNSARCNVFCKTMRWSTLKLVKILTFGYYIRNTIETYQYLLISSISEIKSFTAYSISDILSFLIAVVVVLYCLSFLVFSLILSCKTSDEEVNSNIKEFFVGLKDAKICKLFNTLSLLKTLFYVTILVTVSQYSSFSVILTIVITQCSIIAFLIFVKPYKDLKNNVIEVINQLYILTFFCWLFYFNSSERWNDVASSIFVWLIISNNIFLMLFANVDALKTIIVKLKTVLSKKNSSLTDSNQIKESPLFHKKIQPLNISSNFLKNGRMIEERKINYTENLSNLQMVVINPRQTSWVLTPSTNKS